MKAGKFINILFIVYISNILFSKCADVVTSYTFKHIAVTSTNNYDTIIGVSFQGKLLVPLLAQLVPNLSVTPTYNSVNTIANPFRVAMNAKFDFAYILQTSEPEQTVPLIDNRYTSGYFSVICYGSPPVTYSNNNIVKPYSLVITQDFNNLVISADNLYVYNVGSNPSSPVLMLTIPLNGTTAIDVTSYNSVTNGIFITTYDYDNSKLGNIYITLPGYSYTLNTIDVNTIRDICNTGYGFATVNLQDTITLYTTGLTGSTNTYQGDNSNTPNYITSYSTISGIEYILINFMPSNSTSIMAFKNQQIGTSFCYYNVKYETDAIVAGASSGYVHATQINGPFVVIDTFNDVCASSISNNSLNSTTIWIIVGCSIGGVCLLLICCGLCFKENSSGDTTASRVKRFVLVEI